MISAFVLFGSVLVLATIYYLGRRREKMEVQGTGEGVPETVSPEFQTLLDVYSKAYAHYRVNGDAASKAVYMKAQENIESSIKELRDNMETDNGQLNEFLETYASNETDLVKLHEQSKKLEELTPQLQDQYDTTVKRKLSTIEPSIWIMIIKVSLVLVFLGTIAYLLSSRQQQPY